MSAKKKAAKKFWTLGGARPGAGRPSVGGIRVFTTIDSGTKAEVDLYASANNCTVTVALRDLIKAGLVNTSK